jgi:tetratricopeptide (TPR) repeat protein
MASEQMHLRFASAADAPVWRERALREAERAAALDGVLGETHQALADVYGKTEFEWDRVILESRRALALNSSLHLPHAYLARAFYHLGLLERADEEARAALALEPDGVDGVRALGITHFLAGRFGEAVPRLEEVQRLSGKPLSDYYLALAYYYSGDARRGEAILEELTRASSASSAQRARSWLAAFLAARGERARAEELVAQVAAGKFMDHHVAAGLGDAHAQLGRTDDAMRWVRQAADTGFPCRPWYATDSLLQPLRATPAFQAWLDGLERQQAEAERLHDRQ